MHVDLNGRTALVTGGGRGIGRAIVLELLRAGARVALTSTDRASLDETIKASGAGERAVAIVADLTDREAPQRIVDAANTAFGHVDILVNNAGISSDALDPTSTDFAIPFWKVSQEMLRRFFDINSIAPQMLAILLAPGMMERKWGRIINITTGLSTMLKLSTYGGSKAALEAHTSGMALDMEGTGVTANVVVPGGPTATRMTERYNLPPDSMLKAESLAPPVLYLCSPAGDRITGRRYVAALWDPKLPPVEAEQKAGAPVAWTGYGVQSIAVPGQR